MYNLEREALSIPAAFGSETSDRTQRKKPLNSVVLIPGNEVLEIPGSALKILCPLTHLFEDPLAGRILQLSGFHLILQVVLKNFFYPVWPDVHESPHNPLGDKQEVVS